MSRGGFRVDRNSNQYTFMFALVVCVVCSLALSTVFAGLKSKRELNIALDIKKNILKAVSLKEPLFKRKCLIAQLAGVVTVNTNITAKPKPTAVSTFFEQAKNEHIPKK